MHPGSITQYIDVAEVALAAFGVFFVLLVVYLQRESNREGFPLVEEPSGHTSTSIFGMPSPKTFILADGSRHSPEGKPDLFPINASRSSRNEGDPLTPNGDPMLAAVGPGAYALRADVPDLTFHGKVKIVPLRAAPDYHIPPQDKSPIGMPVIGGDGKVAGEVSDVWVDRAEVVIRYLEVAVAGAGKSVLLPMNFARLSNGRVHVHAIFARHFANVPGLRNPEQITFLEEEKVMAYYGAGKLYAHPSRAEPIL